LRSTHGIRFTHKKMLWRNGHFYWETKVRTNLSRYIAASLLAMTSALAIAQSTTPNAPTSDQKQNASGTGMHRKSDMHYGERQCCGRNYTTGWSMMDSKERSEHREKMRSMKSYDECKAYVDEHRAKMVERAKEKGRTVPATPRRDACAWLKK
jgi:hypothetical protein